MKLKTPDWECLANNWCESFLDMLAQRNEALAERDKAREESKWSSLNLFLSQQFLGGQEEAREWARYYKKKFDVAEKRIDQLSSMIWRDN